MKKVYLDVCALCRPFDDQSYVRIRLETEAVNLILANVRAKAFRLVASPAHFREIAAIGDLFERIKIEVLLYIKAERIKTDLSSVQNRAEQLIKNGFGPADAAHVAFAESVGADFISCDDKLVKQCLGKEIKVWVGNPTTFCDKEFLR